MLPAFAADQVVDRLTAGHLSLYMAVPTIYHRLITHLDQMSDEATSAFRDGVGRLRLMVSGSAALPVPVLERWRELSGHTLLERYGMTEIGMGLSNTTEGSASRARSACRFRVSTFASSATTGSKSLAMSPERSR
jgi:malonyl-CoA/methylmalonyl-CoA synthetase